MDYSVEFNFNSDGSSGVGGLLFLLMAASAMEWNGVAFFFGNWYFSLMLMKL
jgi:hypothetical protein